MKYEVKQVVEILNETTKKVEFLAFKVDYIPNWWNFRKDKIDNIILWDITNYTWFDGKKFLNNKSKLAKICKQSIFTFLVKKEKTSEQT